MDKGKLLKLIEEGENQSLEFKTNPSEELGNTICAFANTNSGIILLGIGDEKIIVGCSIKVEAQVKEFAYSCKPSIHPEIEHLKVDGKNVFLVKVGKSYEIHSYKDIEYKRIGTQDIPMLPGEDIVYARSSGAILFDSQLCEDAKLSDLGKDTIKMFRERYETLQGESINSDDKSLLKNLSGIKENQITNAGALLFASEPQKFFPLAYITVVRYPGNSDSDKYLDIKNFKGDLFSQIDQVDIYMREHLRIGSHSVSEPSDREIFHDNFSVAAREILINAVAHRDYFDQGGRITIKIFKDRIEYSSPGGFLPGITADNIANRQWSRNPTIINILKKAGYLEAVGNGIDNVLETVKTHQDLPKFEDKGTSVNITLYGTDTGKMEITEIAPDELNERQRKAIDIIKEIKSITNKEYSEIFDISKGTGQKDLTDLEKKKLISRKGRSRGTYYVLE